MRRACRALAIALLAALAAILLSASTAAAQTGPRPDDPCLTDPTLVCEPAPASESHLLPVNRWAAATGQMHARLGDMPWDDTLAKIQRGATYPTLITLGNSMWSGATGMVSAAVRMDILDAAGQTADNAAATIGGSLLSSGVLAAMALIAVMVPAWRAARGQGPGAWGAVVKVAATVALFSVMLSGAAHSTTDAAGKFRPGFMSPGWFVTTTNTVLSSLASAPAAALVSKSDVGAGYAYAEGSTGEMSCAQYVDRLKADYLATNPASAMENSLPLVMSGMWEATGLKVWSVSQFGASNPYGDFAYCRMLEQFAGTSPAEQRSITVRASSNPNVAASNVYSLAWAFSQDVQLDRSMVGWAQCRPGAEAGTWTLAPGWEKADGAADAPSDCQEWWTMVARFNDAHGNWFGDGQSTFNWDGADHIVADAGDLRVKDYLLTLQGKTGAATGSLAMVYAYVLSALVILIMFGLVAVSIIVAKVSAVVLMLMVFFALLLSLWPGNAGKQSSIGRYLAQYVGMALLVFGVQLIFAFLTLITSVLVKAGTQMFGDGATVISMVWTGFAPVVAVLVLHQVFKKVLKVPSPFSVTGAMQWGQAAAGGAVGAAAGSALMNRAHRMRMRSEYALMRRGEQMGSRALGVVSGGRLGSQRRGAGRAGALTVGSSGASNAQTTGAADPTAKKARRGAVWGADQASASPATGRPSSPVGRKAQRIADNAAAAERGHRNTLLGRHKEGTQARWAHVREAMREHPVKTPARGAVRSGAKAAGAAALVVASGGLAAPAVAAVWGARHVHRTKEARAGAVSSFEAAKAAAELAAAEEAKKKDGTRAKPPRKNSRPVVTVERRSAADRGTAAPRPRPKTPEAREPAAAAPGPTRGPRRGEKPFQ